MITIIRGTDAIDVAHPVFLMFGQPGIGKSTLGYSMRDVLTLDFDLGAHRAANRRDTVQVATWEVVAALLTDPTILEPYAALCVDTVGRCLDLMTIDIIETSPKLARDGTLTQQGWGQLKTRFRTFVSQIRALNKDLLLLAHDKEDKDGELRIVRPDITGGSYGEVLKNADFVGYLSMIGKHRVLEFSPTDRWVGKNPAGWRPLTVPPVEQATDFMADLYARGREALGTISERAGRLTAQAATPQALDQVFVQGRPAKEALDEAAATVNGILARS